MGLAPAEGLVSAVLKESFPKAVEARGHFNPTQSSLGAHPGMGGGGICGPSGLGGGAVVWDSERFSPSLQASSVTCYLQGTGSHLERERGSPGAPTLRAGSHAAVSWRARKQVMQPDPRDQGHLQKQEP